MDENKREAYPSGIKINSKESKEEENTATTKDNLVNVIAKDDHTAAKDNDAFRIKVTFRDGLNAFSKTGELGCKTKIGSILNQCPSRVNDARWERMWIAKKKNAIIENQEYQLNTDVLDRTLEDIGVCDDSELIMFSYS